MAVDQLNTHDVVASDDVIFTQGAFDAFVGGAATATEPPATVVEAPAADAVARRSPEKKAAKKASGPKADAEKPAETSRRCPRAPRPR